MLRLILPGGMFYFGSDTDLEGSGTFSLMIAGGYGFNEDNQALIAISGSVYFDPDAP